MSNTPVTEAGRRLVAHVPWDETSLTSDIVLAIEAEAAARPDIEKLARAIQRAETPEGEILPPIQPFLDRAEILAYEYACLTSSEAEA